MSSSPLSSVVCVGTDAASLNVITLAAQRLNAHATIRTFVSLGEAIAARSDAANALLVLGEPTPVDVASALTATDEHVLPRWAVVVLGGIRTPSSPATALANPRSERIVASNPGADGDGFDVPLVARDEWTPPLLAQVFRGVLAALWLRRENARLRGDLMTFGSRIAHDLRTPLGGVLTTAEMLREILSDSDPASAGLTQPIVDSTEGLAKLIERMSFFAKAIASREPPQSVDMGTPFWNAFQQLESRLLKAGATLTQPRDWPTVVGHAAWLQAIWGNLLANAVQHGGASVRIEAGWTRTEDHYRFWLHDSGEVLPDRRAALFRPFHLLSEAGAPRGLGLAVVQRLVERDGGTCGFEVPPTGGSTFFFTLPVRNQSARAEPPVKTSG